MKIIIERITNPYTIWRAVQPIINKEKSALIISDKISNTRIRNLICLIAFSEGKFPTTYLEVHLVPGHMTVWMLEPLVRKICNKVSNWKGWILSQGAHQLVINKINSILNTFLLGEQSGKAKRKWGAWSKLYESMGKGGLGVRFIGEVHKSFFMKFVWRLMSVDNFWTRFLD